MNTALVVIVVVVAIVLLGAILMPPWRRVRAEGRLPPDVEAQLLLGERPEEIDARDAAWQESNRRPGGIDGGDWSTFEDQPPAAS